MKELFTFESGKRSRGVGASPGGMITIYVPSYIKISIERAIFHNKFSLLASLFYLRVRLLFLVGVASVCLLLLRVAVGVSTGLGFSFGFAFCLGFAFALTFSTTSSSTSSSSSSSSIPSPFITALNKSFFFPPFKNFHPSFSHLDFKS